MKTINDLIKKIKKVEKDLEKVRGKEYEQQFGSMRRAKISRKWDEVAKDKMKLLMELEAIENCNRDLHNDDIFNHGECLECNSRYQKTITIHKI